MARPYSDILRAEQLAAELTKYKAYLAKTGAEKSTAYTANKRGDRVKVSELETAFVKPFDIGSGGLNLRLKFESPKSATGAAGLITEGKTILTTARLSTTASTATDTEMALGRFKAAKLRLVEYSGVATDQTSRTTGRKYKQRECNSISLRFGRKSDTESFAEAVKDMTTAAKTWAGGGTGVKRSYKFYPQGNLA